MHPTLIQAIAVERDRDRLGARGKRPVDRGQAGRGLTAPTTQTAARPTIEPSGRCHSE